MSESGDNIRLDIAGLKFVRHDSKALQNERKHKVSFEEAATCWLDSFSMEFDDPTHSVVETRKLLLGTSKLNRLLVCWFTIRRTDQEEAIRIIGARKPTPNERKKYEEKS